MKTHYNVINYIFLLLFCLKASGQEPDIVLNKLTQFIRATDQFSQYIPHEKVYLHFDNTSYYQGDNIWFTCYVVTSKLHQATELSKTLYVELLNPGGEIVDKRVLKIEDGRCHGDFTLGQLPFYSGFYEVRAYTKYMLNFGEDVIFSRLLPVFNKPKEEGNFEENAMEAILTKDPIYPRRYYGFLWELSGKAGSMQGLRSTLRSVRWMCL